MFPTPLQPNNSPGIFVADNVFILSIVVLIAIENKLGSLPLG